MQWRSGKDLRELFLSYFEARGHRRFPGFSLIPDDPTLLFTIAGMVPFKPYFLGMRKPAFKRAVTAQKCVRTNDIDNVGRTSRHHTLFEMLGNFSFGDYFKSEAVAFAWEFLTEKAGLDPSRLYPTIFRDDDEAFRIWNSEIGISPDRIYRLGEDDNFWSVGPVGPCGPCSELIYDQGPAFSCGRSDCGVGCECDRYLEVWNLVFMQYNRLENGSLEPLPKQNIDTGMGLERLSSVVQQVSGDFETDLFKPLVEKACEICGIDYGHGGSGDMAARVISDHFRATAFMIADGVLPSNDGRGYVLRRILRRAVRYGRLSGIEKPFLMELYPTLVDVMGDPYRELGEQRALIEQVVELEEDRFGKTLEQGLRLLETEIASLRTGKGDSLPGDVAFELYDTFGFPYELTEEVCLEKGISIDREEFSRHMNLQRERARAGARGASRQKGDPALDAICDAYGPTEFSGYFSDKLDTKALAILSGGKRVSSTSAGEEVQIILEATPFYGEGGGQIGDRGFIKADAFNSRVLDTYKYSGGLIVHRASILEGTLFEGATVEATVERASRMAVKSHHTATHLLHESLARVLGDHVTQAGSLVSDEFLRFDFTHMKPMSREEITRVENMVNEQVLENTPLEIIHTDLETARKLGARALFEEKYGDTVRLVRVPGFSAELCGGTHVDATGDIGLFKIIREEGIGSGIRRITALAGLSSLKYFQKVSGTVATVESILSVPAEALEKKISEIQDENRMMAGELEKLRTRLALSKVDELVQGRVNAGPLSVVIGHYEGISIESVRSVGDRIRGKIEGVVVILSVVSGDNAHIIAMADKKAVGMGVNCGSIVRIIAEELGGGGGGRPDMAQAGVKNAGMLMQSVSKAPEIVLSMLSEVH